MTALRSGGTAIEAVEAAIKVLEDREITNAGYGSNLSLDGTVECDATIVDEYGRSGAVGAASHVRNPISLARLVLQRSTEPLSLRRIPPNLLVGDGVTDFAFANSVPILPHDLMVSPSARQRWIRWKAELREAASKDDLDRSNNHPRRLAQASALDFEERARRRNTLDHTKALEGYGLPLPAATAMQACKPVTLPVPPPSLALSDADSPRTPGTPAVDSDPFTDTPIRDPRHSGSHVPSSRLVLVADKGSSSPYHPSTGPHDSPASLAIGPTSSNEDGDGHCSEGRDGPEEQAHHAWSTDAARPRLVAGPPAPQRSELSSIEPAADPGHPDISTTDASLPLLHGAANSDPDDAVEDSFRETLPDRITDTVGAIAVDSLGRIAAGSSSGGIGMKHRGRVGPAALVGVGTVVVPEDVDANDQVSVAVVTSGTGEHITTTMAAATCADRLYHSVRSCGAGMMEYADEDSVMRSVIEKDFMSEWYSLGGPRYQNSRLVEHDDF